MKKYIMAFLFCLLGSIANAQQETFTLNVPLKCGKVDIIFSLFSREYQESPIWVGKTIRNTHVTLLVNKEKHTWTMVEYDSAFACILGAGEISSSPNI